MLRDCAALFGEAGATLVARDACSNALVPLEDERVRITVSAKDYLLLRLGTEP